MGFIRGQSHGHSSTLPALHAHPHCFAAVSTLQKGPGFVCGFSGLEGNGEDSVESGPFLSQGRMDLMGCEGGGARSTILSGIQCVPRSKDSGVQLCSGE